MRIFLEGVTYGYSRRTNVFDGLNLDIDHFPVAVLGPNGAGKSTLLALLAGRLAPQEGRIGVQTGSSSSRIGIRQMRKLTSWMPQDTKALRGLSAREYVAYAGWLKGMKYRDAWSEARSALKIVNLLDRGPHPMNTLSGGQRRRLGIASAMVSEPSVLILDEPYAGLDPDQRGQVRSALRGLSETTALIVSTHQTEDLDSIYGGVIVIDRGEVLFNGSTAEFTAGIPRSVATSDRAEYAYRRVTRGELEGQA